MASEAVSDEEQLDEKKAQATIKQVPVIFLSFIFFQHRKHLCFQYELFRQLYNYFDSTKIKLDGSGVTRGGHAQAPEKK